MPDIDLMGATYPDVPAVTLPSGNTTATFYYPDEIDYASSPTSGGNADRSNAILYGAVDSTSTSTVYTATVDGLDELTDGTCVMLHNGVVTSAAGFTVNINNLGAKKCYNNMTNATQDTTIFNVAYTMLFVYSEDLDSGNGGWWIYRGYDGNTNTIGYQLRTNSGNKTAADTGYRYRIWLTSADGSKWVPINTSTSTNATSNRSLNTRAIDPFGPIVYRATNGTCTSGSGIGATGIWQQYTLTIGYSYMASGFALTFPAPVYLKATPQADGSAVMSSIVQTLPTTKDGKIYIHLGTAYSATNMELQIEHPVYWHDGTGIRLWTGAEPASGGSTVAVTQTLTSGTEVASISVDGTATKLYAPTPPTVPSASSTTPSMDGTAAVGTATTYARADHVHPTDTSRQAALVSGTNIKTVNGVSLLGSGDLAVGGSTVSVAPSLTSGTKSATITVDGTGYDLYAPTPPTASTTAPSMDGTASYGSGTSYARSNHVHPTDTSRAASSHTHGSITNAGAITSDTTVASGDKLVISDSSDSSKLKRSGVAFGTSTSTFLRNDGTWAEPSGGGGGGSWTDISSEFAAANSGVRATFYAITDGTLVYLSVSWIYSDISGIDTPQDYTPSTTVVGTALSGDYETYNPSVVIADTGGSIDEYAGGTLFSFTITYPIA